MFATLKQITAPTNKDLRKRIYFTLGALLIFIIGTNLLSTNKLLFLSYILPLGAVFVL